MDLHRIGWNKFFSDNFEKYHRNELIPARIISEQKKSYILLCEEGELFSSARGILWHDKRLNIGRPVVGDWVAISPVPENKTANIVHILPRKNTISRRSPGGRKKYSGGKIMEQVIVANIDIGIITVGLDRDYSLRRIERYLILVQGSGVKPLIILNKADLCADTNKIKKEVKYIANGIPVITMIALQKKDVKVLFNYVQKGETAALLGSSGVGKSTIINQLLGYQRQKVTEISTNVKKGQHTTSRRELIMLSNGGILIDNPGMREIQLWADEDDISQIFYDIELLAQSCRFRDCQHGAEPGCAVLESVYKGTLSKSRLENYKKMKSEIIYLVEKQKRKK